MLVFDAALNIPGISIPAGQTPAGMPLGLQLQYKPGMMSNISLKTWNAWAAAAQGVLHAGARQIKLCRFKFSNCKGNEGPCQSVKIQTGSVFVTGPAAENDGFLLVAAKAVEAVMPAIPPPTFPPACQGCTPSVEFTPKVCKQQH